MGAPSPCEGASSFAACGDGRRFWRRIRRHGATSFAHTACGHIKRGKCRKITDVCGSRPARAASLRFVLAKRLVARRGETFDAFPGGSQPLRLGYFGDFSEYFSHNPSRVAVRAFRHAVSGGADAAEHGGDRAAHAGCSRLQRWCRLAARVRRRIRRATERDTSRAAR